MSGLRVLSPGLQTTVQDLGRIGCGSFGVPRSGALDALSARIANRLAGNPDGEAVLEMTMTGGRFETVAELAVALAGAPMPASVNGKPAASNETLFLQDGDRLEVGVAPAGARTYLAVAGGFDVPSILGSRSTCLPARFGGWKGRAVEKGDVLPAARAERPPRRRRLGRPAAPEEAGEAIRVLPGPQAAEFPDRALHALFSGEFRVSPRSNRMGLRLTGNPVAAAEPPEILPEGVVSGCVQVPAGGEPIILLADGPVTGGYPKIAVVIAADLGRLGQLRPGEAVRFARTDLETARAARVAQERIFSTIIEA